MSDIQMVTVHGIFNYFEKSARLNLIGCLNHWLKMHNFGLNEPQTLWNEPLIILSVIAIKKRLRLDEVPPKKRFLVVPHTFFI